MNDKSKLGDILISKLGGIDVFKWELLRFILFSLGGSGFSNKYFYLTEIPSFESYYGFIFSEKEEEILNSLEYI